MSQVISVLFLTLLAISSCGSGGNLTKPNSRTYGDFLYDSISNIKIYCYCCNFTQYEVNGDTASTTYCTSSFPRSAASIMEESTLVKEVQSFQADSIFKNLLGKDQLISVDSLENVLVDARMAIEVTYTNGYSDTVVVNGSGRIILNRKYILHYKSFKTSMRRLVAGT